VVRQLFLNVGTRKAEGTKRANLERNIGKRVRRHPLQSNMNLHQTLLFTALLKTGETMRVLGYIPHAMGKPLGYSNKTLFVCIMSLQQITGECP